MKRVLILPFILLLCFPTLTHAQRDSLRTLFLDAESWFLFEEYADALPLYMTLHKYDPGNDNLKYKIGICLLNDPYQKDQSIRYLLEASENIDPDYKENSFKETNAPPDALFHLGNAYLVNELLDLAIQAYEEFLDILDPEVYDAELVRFQIKACENARRLKSMPVDLDLFLLDSLINTRYADIHPVLSGDGTKMAFITRLPFYDGAFFCEKTEEGWSYPQPITQTLGFDADIYPVSLSYDGTEMILYYDDNYIGNLYYSTYEEGRWLPATRLEEPISTKYWESHGCFSRDGNSLYFTSNRKGGYGGLDIYRSDRQADGSWGEPVNLGPSINSRYNEECPFLTMDGQTLYFSSYGHFNMGGYDIFYSKRKSDGSWEEPVNVGYPVNTTDDDLFFQPVRNGFGAYYSIYSPAGRGRHDIYRMEIYSVDNPRMYMVSGQMKTEDGIIDSTQIAIRVIDANSGDTLLVTAPATVSGEFSVQLPQGEYELRFLREGYEEVIRPLAITALSDKSGVRIGELIELSPIVKVPLVFEGDESMIELRDTLYEGVAGEPLRVPVRVPRGTRVTASIIHDSVVVGTDTLDWSRRRNELEIIPLPGTSRVELEATDKDGNLHRNRFTVVGAIPEEEVTESAGPITPGEAEGPGEEVPGAEGPISGMQPGQPEAALGVTGLLHELQSRADGNLKAFLDTMDLEKAGPGTPEELFLKLYDRSDSLGFTREEVDQLLAGTLADGDVYLFYQQLLENSDGALREYLMTLDLEDEGIMTPEDLLRHMAEVAEREGFTMDQVRQAMLRSLSQPLEVERIYRELLQTAEDPVLGILEELDLRGEGIHTVEALIRTLYSRLEELGYSRREIVKMLSELFPGYVPFMEELSQTAKGKATPWVVGGLALVGILWLIIFLLRKRRRPAS